MSSRSHEKDFHNYWSLVKPQLDQGCRQWIPELSRTLHVPHQRSFGREDRGRDSKGRGY